MLGLISRATIILGKLILTMYVFLQFRVVIKKETHENVVSIPEETQDRKRLLKGFLI